MRNAVFYLDRDDTAGLQTQIRQQLIESIVSGAFGHGARLPSSRKLAADLNVSRNTVLLAYQQLVADGYLSGQERSGVFVDAQFFEGLPARERPAEQVEGASSQPWRSHVKAEPGRQAGAGAPPSWQLHPYPFVDDRFDASLSPLSEWRDATHAASSAMDFNDWSGDASEADDAKLVREIQTKILPRRGVHVGADQILVTSGPGHALHLLSLLLVKPATKVVMEDPGWPVLRQMLRMIRADVAFQPLDGDGMVVDERLHRARVVFVTPSRQLPTNQQMSPQRRQALWRMAQAEDQLIVEYDLPASGGFADSATPALKSMDRDGRVIYVADVCDLLGPALRLSFVVADAGLIRELRRLRSATSGHIPRASQRIAAFFLSLGHYDAAMGRLNRVLRQRLTSLRDALNYHLPQLVEIDPRSNGASIWVEGPAAVPARLLAKEAAKRGVLIDPADRFHADRKSARNLFRMGVAGVADERIRPGVAILAEVLQGLLRPEAKAPEIGETAWLPGEAVRARISGATLLCRTVYGDPYTVEVQADGGLVGTAGYAGEDCDVGQWWMEGDVWCRRWTQWSYGETARFLTEIQGDEILWYKEDRVLFNRGVLVRAPANLA